MGMRPSELFHLFGDLNNLSGIGPKTVINLKNLSIEKPRDFLFNLPFSVLDRLPVSSIRGVPASKIVTVEVLVKAHKIGRSRASAYRVTVQDTEVSFQLVFFNARKEYLENLFPVGERRIISGKLEFYDNIPQIVHPHHVKKINEEKAIVRFEPVYPLTTGVSQKLMFGTINTLLEKLPKLGEWIDHELLKIKGWPSWHDALKSAHCPVSADGASNTNPARLRLAFDELFSHPNLKKFTNEGPVTPDHVIRIKSKPLIIDLSKEKSNNLEKIIIQSIENFRESYKKYFKRNHKYNSTASMLDPYPRLILVKGIGIFSTGPTFKDAKIAMDVGLNSLSVILQAAKFGNFKSIPEKEIFRMEYWPLELAKIKNSSQKLKGQVAVVTGGLGGIGYVTAQKFKAEGADVIIIDIISPKDIKQDITGINYIKCDITNENKIRDVFKEISSIYGGVDILISNAGFATVESLEKLTRQQFDKSFDLNLFAHHYFVKHGVEIMKRQKTRGVVLFNISKQAVNPGKNYAAYGLTKAALLFLMKQYVTEYSDYGIRFNGVNADRIRSGLMTDDMITKRSKARGLTTKQYMSGNLLKQEVKAIDVAEAFYHLALSYKSTASVITVDGGNLESSFR